VHGAVGVARFMVLIAGRAEPGMEIRAADINGRPGRVLVDAAGNAIGALVLDVADGAIRRVDFVVNPDKLGRV
jgi:hypothetical protein